MKLIKILFLCFTMVTTMQSNSQTIQVNNFELRCEDCLGIVKDSPNLRAETIKIIEDKLSAKLGIKEFIYINPDKFIEKKNTFIFPGIKPKITEGKADYFANIIYRFVKGGTTSTPKYTIQNVNFKLQVFVVNKKRKKVLKESIVIPAQKNAFTPYIHDQWYSVEDIEYLLQTANSSLFLKKKGKPKRRVLKAGKSEELKAFLDKTDSLLLRNKKKNYMLFSEGDEVQRFVMKQGVKNEEFTERFFNLDLSDRIKQKISIDEMRSGKRYDVVSSVSAQENFNHSWTGDEDDPMVTFYEGDTLVSALTLIHDDLIGKWGTDTLKVIEIDSDYLEYRMNNEKVGLSAQLTVIEGGKKNRVTKFHFLKSLTIEEIQKLIYAYFAHNLAVEMEYEISMEDD
ncbi:hypothetical protein SAMN05421640_0079 [Ekhidna lutea]|uniref:Copper chaperone CopZ n=1 Tax=Ekhidna lutea TaxID=447679 RepID=A0A239ECH4_EKHLU|nr:hypothetical protein [Ekhidna lutea]SNS42375.1 hypothetical protein SAMN05421640_0079 [Ekhidna lutea]